MKASNTNSLVYFFLLALMVASCLPSRRIFPETKTSIYESVLFVIDDMMLDSTFVDILPKKDVLKGEISDLSVVGKSTESVRLFKYYSEHGLGLGSVEPEIYEPKAMSNRRFETIIFTLKVLDGSDYQVNYSLEVVPSFSSRVILKKQFSE